MDAETCENCGAPIGALESAHVWKERVVCAACHARLSPATPPAPTPVIPYATPTPPMPTPPPAPPGILPRATGPMFICPNAQCGYQGPSIKEAKGSAAIGCLLCLIMVLPGLLYLIFMSGYRYRCPKCGNAVMLGD